MKLLGAIFNKEIPVVGAEPQKLTKQQVELWKEGLKNIFKE